MLRKCKLCPSEFDIYKGQGSKIYCSEKCRSIAKAKRERQYYVKKHGVKLCIYCHIVLEGNSSKFCSKTCMKKHYKLDRLYNRYRSEMKKRNCIRKRRRENKEEVRKYRRRWRERRREELKQYYREYRRKKGQ